MTTRILAAASVAIFLGFVLSGCTGVASPVPSRSEGAGSSAEPPFGASTLSPPASHHTIATAGDSHAVRFAQGMTDVAGGAYEVVNGGYGGCGIMRESKYKLTTYGIDRPEAANRACDDWDVKWAALVGGSKPDAVLLTTSYWDTNAQVIDDSGVFRTIEDPVFRTQYERSLQEGIDILSSRGARVYLDDSLPYLGHDMKAAEAMSAAVQEVYRKARAAGKNVRLLALREQLCKGTDCPTSISGIAVTDETGHPAGESLARQSRWILNTISADLQKG